MIFDSLGGTLSPRVWGLEVGAPKTHLVGLEPKGFGFAPIYVWAKTMDIFRHVMD